MLRRIALELRVHAPFTAFGALTGIVIMVAMLHAELPQSVSEALFWTTHPLHVLLSAVATTAMYRNRGRRGIAASVTIGYVGSIAVGTLSDSVIPFLGEWLLGLPNRGVHVGFIERWWLVNPLALLGVAIGYARPVTKLPHAGHVLLSTWASLFHMTLAVGGQLAPAGAVLVVVFLFLAVWIPCCTSDIAFPLLFVAGDRSRDAGGWEAITSKG